MTNRGGKIKVKQKTTAIEVDDELASIVSADNVELMSNALRQAFKLHHKLIVSELTRQIRTNLGCALEARQSSSSDNPAEWKGIESLSRLRSIVGGRFQNIKARWIQSGFPLREHRGDKWKNFQLNERGWLELSNWMMKQGYEARLTPDDPRYLFEVRQTR